MKSRKVKSAARSKAFMKKLKGTIPLDVEDSYDENEDKDSIDDEEEDFQHKEESSNEEEVLPITDDESDVSDETENHEESAEEDDLPNLNYWGKKKSMYYNADFVDKDRGKTYREEDLELENAEREAAYLQQQAATELDRFESSAYLENYDRAIELISKKLPPQSQGGEIEDVDEPEEEKLKHEKRKYPKLHEYKESFKEKFAEVNNKLAPLIELLDSLKVEENFALYVKLKYQILLHYLLNISFYLYLKNLENVPENHPIYERIEQFKELNDRMNSFKNYQSEIDIILERLRQNENVPLSKDQDNFMELESKNKDISSNKVKVSKKKKKAFKQFETEEEKEILGLYNDRKGQQKNLELNDEIEEMDQDLNHNNPVEESTGEKRTITYQIAKNKGLVPKRKKEYRNPRVHHRLKFRKAKIRRKGQVREVVKEIKRYAGEPTGISAHVVRSVKLK